MIIDRKKGAYVLVLKLDHDTDIQVGKPGILHFEQGFYAYIGSALGGFKRVTRHFKVASGEKNVRKWHIDYLLPHIKIICAVLLPVEENIECAIAGEMTGFSEIITGFGCTDCTCRAHLFFSKSDFLSLVINTCEKITGNESIIIRPHI